MISSQSGKYAASKQIQGAIYKAYGSVAAMCTRLGFLKGHTQAVLCCEALVAQSLLASGDEVRRRSCCAKGQVLSPASHIGRVRQ